MLVAVALDVVLLELAAFEVEDVVFAELVDVLLTELVVETEPPLFEILKIAISWATSVADTEVPVPVAPV